MQRKGDLSDFEYAILDGGQQGGLSISETTDVLGFSCATIYRVHGKWSEI